jgi:putative spermidine/putrescine transport system substrate-binding protein
MLNRRYFLITATNLTLSLLITGCNEDNTLKILLLQGSIPPQLIAAFRKKIKESKNLVLKPEINIKELFTLLKTWQGKNKEDEKEKKWTLPSFKFGQKKEQIPNLITITDYDLTEAIKEQLIEPISIKELSHWNQIPDKFIQLVKHNSQNKIDLKDKIWAAPYRWGCTMIAYRKDKFEELNWTPTDWSDLWRKEIQHRFSLLNHQREVIGLTLKKLGYSYNTPNLSTISKLKSELIALNKQVKFYDSTNYLEPLILGDTILAVGWSSDILPIIKRYPNIEGIIPVSGTSLWADLWVKPKSTKIVNSALINNWINFCWETDSVKQINLFSNASSPIIFSLNESDLPKDIINNSLKYPNSNIMKKSDFIIPFEDEKIDQEYQELWQEIRQRNIM